MDSQKINDDIRAEMDSLRPAQLSEQEESVWLASFNAMRLADFSNGEILGAEVVAMQATAQAILSAHCDPVSSLVTSDDNKVVTVVCSNPRSDTNEFLASKTAAFPLWGFSVTSNSSPNGIHEKIVFKRRER